jgi:hypothetical protein
VGKIALLTAILAHAVFGQAQAGYHRIDDLLASPSLVDKAWGVFYAGRLHVPSLNARLIDQLNSMEPHRDAGVRSAERAYLQTIFDALIVSGTVVPARNLMPFAERWPDEVLILLARELNNDDALMELRAKDLGRAQSLLVNNLLLRMRSPQLFARLLNEIPMTHRFQIIAKGEATGIAGGAGGTGVACGTNEIHKSFPPIGLYQLVVGPVEGGATLVARGPRDVYYRRTVVPTDQQVGWSIEFTSRNEKHHQEYFAALLGMNVDRIRSTFSAISYIEWEDQDAFIHEARSRLESQSVWILSLLAEAKQLGFTVPSGKAFRIAVEIEDSRLTALPPVPRSLPAKEFYLQ